ncbi:MAG: hypothetical protein A2Y00_08900 [Omnitrophica WOR_2 bacterium GWF2_43_52]|nr:MAG: hypothetical protein A2Y00_08900 [Omnitrophica WOR_2 bacterium GWF2_43_52]OGX56696.1 MAG: hypothetical protein A2460_06040 [Omnitrophica WOR_2 bacterium RIFOXYC2_FULL_43_9]HBG62831.1 hypothetical protein [Candidatus Omnitrophota bacterium]
MANEAILHLLQDMGFVGQNGSPIIESALDPFDFDARPPQGLNEFKLTQTFPRGEIFQEIIRNELIPEIDKALENLGIVLAQEKFVSYWESQNPISGTVTAEIDYADVAILKSLLCAIKAKLQEGLVNNLNSNLSALSGLFSGGLLSPRYVLEQYPQLLRVENLPQSFLAREALVLAIDSYIKGYNFMKDETDEQSDDLISINHASIYRQEAEAFTKELQDMKKSLLSQPDSEFSMRLSHLVDLGYWFSNPFEFRRLLDAGAMSYSLNDYLLPQTNYLLDNVSKASITYNEFLPPDPYIGNKIEADFADVQAMKTGAEALRMVSLGLSANNLNVGTQEIILRWLETGQVSITDELEKYPDFLTLEDTTKIATARQAFTNIVNGYKETTAYLLNNEELDQSDDVLVPTDYFWANEPRYRTMLEQLDTMENTLIDPTTEAVDDEFHLNLAEYFTNYKNLRQYLPAFDEENHQVEGLLPDQTFGGVIDKEF